MYLCMVLVSLLGLTAAQNDSYRLPPNYALNHYHIELTFPTTAFTAASDDYSGSVEIQFQVTVKTKEVKLHASRNTIELVKVQLADADIPNTSYSVDNDTDILTINSDKELEPKIDYTLKISFKAKLLATDEGLYKVAYVDENNATQYIIATQFQDVSARKAFPCFDEPRYKATFDFTLTYPDGFEAWANTPANKTSDVDKATGLKTTTYDKSPKMAVYTVAFTISKFTCTEGSLEGKDEYKYHVCSRKDRTEFRDEALYVTPRVIDYMNGYTGINYTTTIPKLDESAIPSRGGAMENWGLVLYTEWSLLYNKDIQLLSSKQATAFLMAHELAHQWFGNLVTCKWWSELFLNEGFAVFFEKYIVDSIYPEYEAVMQFIVGEELPMMLEDSYLNTRALVTNVSTQEEIAATFGSYSYSKGASVIRMLEHVLGPDNFKEGIRKYLKKMSYQAAEPADLVSSLEEALDDSVSKLPVRAKLSNIVQNWFEKSGYPVLNVNFNGSSIEISQERFLLEGSETEKNRWYVPITYSKWDDNNYNQETAPMGWLAPARDYTIDNFDNSTGWIVLNNQFTGYFRVNYDTTLWNNLAEALKSDNFSGIHVANRVQVIDDSFNFVQVDKLTFAQLFKNIEFLNGDVSYFCWRRAMVIFNYLLDKIGPSSKLGIEITKHLLRLSDAVADSVPLNVVDADDPIYTLNQILINQIVCKYGNQKCIYDAKRAFASYRHTGKKININARQIIYCNALRYSDDPLSDWQFMWEEYGATTESELKAIIRNSMGCSTNATVINAYLSKVLSEDDGETVIEPSQYNVVFSTVYRANEEGVDVVLDYLLNNLPAILQKYDNLKLNLSEVVTGIGGVVTKTSQIEKLEQLLEASTSDALKVAVNAAINTANKNQEIVAKYQSDLYSFYGLHDDADDPSGGNGTADVPRTASFCLVLLTLAILLL